MWKFVISEIVVSRTCPMRPRLNNTIISVESASVGRLGTENDIADAVFFLAVKATYVTGQTIAVDGGSSNSL